MAWPPGRAGRLTTPSQRPRGPRDPQRRPSFRQDQGRIGALPPDTTPLPPSPAPRYPPPMPHARNLLEQPLARTVRMDDRMRFGAQQQGIVSTPRSVLALVLYLQCVTSATERMPRQALHSYAGPAEPSSPQIRRGPGNKVPKPHPEARKTQGIRGDHRRRNAAPAGSRSASGRSEQHGGNWWAAQDSNL